VEKIAPHAINKHIKYVNKFHKKCYNVYTVLKLVDIVTFVQRILRLEEMNTAGDHNAAAATPPLSKQTQVHQCLLLFLTSTAGHDT